MDELRLEGPEQLEANLYVTILQFNIAVKIGIFVLYNSCVNPEFEFKGPKYDVN